MTEKNHGYFQHGQRYVAPKRAFTPAEIKAMRAGYLDGTGISRLARKLHISDYLIQRFFAQFKAEGLLRGRQQYNGRKGERVGPDVPFLDPAAEPFEDDAEEVFRRRAIAANAKFLAMAEQAGPRRSERR